MIPLIEKVVPGFTYHIVPAIAGNKKAITDLLAPLVDDPNWGAVQVPPLWDPDIADRLGCVLRMAGMTAIYGVGQSLSREGLNLHSLDERIRQASVTRTMRCIDEAYAMGARIMDFNPGKDPGLDFRAQAKMAFVESFARLCEYAQKKATDYLMALSIENFDRYVDKKLYLGPTSETIEAVRDIRTRVPNMGITLDIAHLLIMGENPYISAAFAGDLIFHAHLANFIDIRSDPRWGDKHPPFGVKGSAVSTNQLASFIAGLRDIGYFDSSPKEFRKRIVTFEIRPGENEPVPTVMAGSMRLLRNAVATADATGRPPAAESFVIRTRAKMWLDNITDLVRDQVAGKQDGLVQLSIPHTTAAIFVAEDDGNLREDYMRIASETFTGLRPFRHIRKNNPNTEAHVFSSLFGTSLSVAVEAGDLQLGEFQNIMFLEMDGPKERTVTVRHW